MGASLMIFLLAVYHPEPQKVADQSGWRECRAMMDGINSQVEKIRAKKTEQVDFEAAEDAAVLGELTKKMEQANNEECHLMIQPPGPQGPVLPLPGRS